MGVVNLDQVLTFGLAAFILIVIPGPSVVFVIGRALAYGQGVALASVIGNSLGLFVVMGLVAFGLGALLLVGRVVQPGLLGPVGLPQLLGEAEA